VCASDNDCLVFRAYIRGDSFPGQRASLPSRNYKRRYRHSLSQHYRDGTFTDVSTKAGIANPNGKRARRLFCGLRRRWFHRHLRGQRFRAVFPLSQQRKWHFSEVGLLAMVGFNEGGNTFAGMGADFVSTATALPTLWSRTFPTSVPWSFVIPATAPFETQPTFRA
jgi:hypothetical protein